MTPVKGSGVMTEVKCFFLMWVNGRGWYPTGDTVMTPVKGSGVMTEVKEFVIH